MRKGTALFLASAMALVLGSGAAMAGEKVTATGTGQGIDGDVVVQVEADAETLYSIEVLEQNETPGIGSVAVEELPGAMVEANSILVDDIAGATVTSTAIKTAIREALEEAGLDPAAFEVEVADKLIIQLYQIEFQKLQKEQMESH